MHQTHLTCAYVLAIPIYNSHPWREAFGYSIVLVTIPGLPGGMLLSHYDAIHSPNFDMYLTSPKTRMIGQSKGEDGMFLA